MIKNDELYVVKKNNFVQEYKIKNLSLVEIRIINFLISNIKSPKFDKKFNKFKFEINEFCKAIEPEKKYGSAYERIPGIIKTLADKSAWKEVPSEENPGKTKEVLIRWIERPEFEEGYITLELNPYLAPFLLEVDQNFFEAKFKYTALAQSKYTIPLYELLKSWEKSWKNVKRFEVLELHDYMDVPENARKNVYEFKRRCLDPAVNEINEITDLFVTYEEIKRGRKTIWIEFKIIKKENIKDVDEGEMIPGQTNIFDEENKKAAEKEFTAIEEAKISLYKPLYDDYEITDEEVLKLYKRIRKALDPVLLSRLPVDQDELIREAVRYLLDKASAYTIRDSIFKYINTMIDNEDWAAYIKVIEDADKKATEEVEKERARIAAQKRHAELYEREEAEKIARREAYKADKDEEVSTQEELKEKLNNALK